MLRGQSQSIRETQHEYFDCYNLMYFDPKFCLNLVHFYVGLSLVTTNRSSDSWNFKLL